MQEWQEMGKKPKKILVWLNEAVYQNFVTLNVGTDIKKNKSKPDDTTENHTH